jgi:purine catabolism regulator
MWRSFDVRAVIESLPFTGAALSAGVGGTSRRVTRARVVSNASDLDRVGPNELVVTTVDMLEDITPHGSDQLVARLDAVPIAGLAVRLGMSDHLARDFVEAADQLSLPVVTFPRDTDLADLASAVLNALLDAQRRRLDLFLEVHQRFTRIMLAGGGVAEIATTLHELLTYPVAVVGGDGRPTVEVPSNAFATVDVDAGVRQPIPGGDHDYGEVVAFPGAKTLNEDERVALERAAAAVAVHLAQATAIAQTEERFAAVSLEELVAGHASGADVAERAISFGRDLARPRAVLLASIDPTDGPTPTGALNTIAAAARATLGPDAIVWMRTSTIAALIAPATDDASERRALAEGMRRELDARVRSVTVSIGVGRRVDSPDDLPRSFTEASRAVDVGRWAKGRHVTEVYDELGLERLLASTPTDDLAEFVEQAIGPLVVHDRDHQTELVDTLAAWLDTRNMAEAARRLHVHYNTLKNRMERIEAILGPVVTDAVRALECEVAIYVARHYDIAQGPVHEPRR